MVTIANNTVFHIWKLLRVNLEKYFVTVYGNVYYTYWEDHFSGYENIKSLSCTSKSSMLYVSHISIKKIMYVKTLSIVYYP